MHRAEPRRKWGLRVRLVFRSAAFARPFLTRTAAIAALSGLGLTACVTTDPQSYTTTEIAPDGEVRFRSDRSAASFGTSPAAPVAPAITGLSGAAAYTVLPNRTNVPGANTLERRGGALRGTSADAVLRAAGPLPAPFEFLLASDLQPARGQFGALFYYAQRFVGGTNCVLALQPEPQGTGVLLLRNCVPGGQAEALAPLTTGARL